MAFQMHVQIPYFTNVPEDVIVNVFSFSYVTLNPSAADWLALRARLITFYNTAYAGPTTALQWAPWVNRTAVRFKGYDLLDPIPRAPRHDSTTALTGSAVASSTLVPEEAVCLSFQGALSSGNPQARRRGRIYLGGIGSAQTAGTTTTFPDIASACRGGIAAAASALLAGALVDGWTWGVWSRTDSALVPITNGWIDNAPDTQRRRGNAASARTTWI